MVLLTIHLVLQVAKSIRCVITSIMQPEQTYPYFGRGGVTTDEPSANSKHVPLIQTIVGTPTLAHQYKLTQGGAVRFLPFPVFPSITDTGGNEE